MELVLLLLKIKSKLTLDATHTEAYPFGKNLGNAHRSRRGVYKNIEIAFEAVLESRHLIKLLHKLVGVNALSEVDCQLKAREIDLIAEISDLLELAELIRSAIPAAARADGPHPAKRTFQAIRIEVNRELDAIAPAIEAVIDALIPGGRLSVISFHSLEDRSVKTAFASAASGCICPRDFPVCVCGRAPKIDIITKKPILPSASELAENPRARSAKLRIAEKR